MPRTILRALAAAFVTSVLGMAIAACDSTGIGRTSAIEHARKHATGTVTKVVDARRGVLAEFAPGDESRRGDLPVWSVTFAGEFPFVSCGPPPADPAARPRCPDPATTIRVIVDQASGAFVSAMSPAGLSR